MKCQSFILHVCWILALRAASIIRRVWEGAWTSSPSHPPRKFVRLPCSLPPSWLSQRPLHSQVHCSLVAIMADPTPRETTYTYTFTLNLGSLLSLPSRLLPQLRRVNGLLGTSRDATQYSVASDSDWGTMGTHHGRIPPPTFTPLPGPWGFVTSGYAVGLFAMVTSYLIYFRCIAFDQGF
jgi:hypothetical protein